RAHPITDTSTLSLHDALPIYAELRESKGLLKRIKDALGERVTEVRVSERLRESPACLVLGEHDLPERMRRVLAAAGQKTPQARPDRKSTRLNSSHQINSYAVF